MMRAKADSPMTRTRKASKALVRICNRFRNWVYPPDGACVYGYRRYRERIALGLMLGVIIWAVEIIRAIAGWVAWLIHP
jgi:hypothetical protein